MTTTLVIQAGDDDDVTLPFPEALPGMTAWARVRAYPAGPVLHEWSTANGLLIVETAQVTLTVVDSADWLWRSGEFDIRLDTGLQQEVSGPYRVRVRPLLSGGGSGGGGGTPGNYLTTAHNADPQAHPDIRALIASTAARGVADIDGDGQGNLVFTMTSGPVIVVPFPSIGTDPFPSLAPLGSAPLGSAPLGGSFSSPSLAPLGSASLGLARLGGS